MRLENLQMNKEEYENYQKKVAAFFQREGINNLSTKENCNESFFTWSRCECCAGLPGDRYEASGFNPTTKEIMEYQVCSDCIYYAEYGQLDDSTMLEIEKETK
jgi:Tfp pilus assembly protein PilV